MFIHIIFIILILGSIINFRYSFKWSKKVAIRDGRIGVVSGAAWWINIVLGLVGCLPLKLQKLFLIFEGTLILVISLLSYVLYLTRSLWF